MTDLQLFALTFLFALLSLLIFMNVKTRYPKGSTVPGLDPTKNEDGNIPDISRAGSLHEFLLDLHKQFGPIASFWLGIDYIVSIASPELFKQHRRLFDRPPVMFKLFEPMLGPRSILYASGEDGHSRRDDYDRVFSHANIKQYYQTFQDFADGLCKQWASLMTKERIPLNTHVTSYTLKIDLISLFGYSFRNNSEITEFRQNFDLVWSEMEKRLNDIPEKNSQRDKAFKEGMKKLESSIKRAIQQRHDNPPIQGQELLLDVILEHNTDDFETIFSDAISYAVGGFHTTGNVLTWAIYFLATHIEVQDKAYREIKENLAGRDVDHTNVNNIPYIKQIIDETLRCGVIAPYAARYQDVDSELGGHIIPKNTPVIHAIGVMLQDEKYWPSPKTFDPDRFSPENVKSRPPLAFPPFGFAGKRVCPGYRFAYAEATVFLVSLLGKFQITLAEDQFINPVYGLVTHPDEMIWIKIENR